MSFQAESMEEDIGLNEIRWKIAALEAKNEMLDGKLENMELKAKILLLEAAKKLKEEEEDSKVEELEKRVEICEKTSAILQEMLTKIVAICRGKSQVRTYTMPKGNNWDEIKGIATITEGGLKAVNDSELWVPVFAQKGWEINDENPNAYIYYFEVHVQFSQDWNYYVGLSDGSLLNNQIVGKYPNSYSVADGFEYALFDGERHNFELSNEGQKPNWNESIDVVGCGILRNAGKKCQIFFSLNGILLGNKCEISPSADRLYPTVTLYPHSKATANFGGGGKAWKMDIKEFIQSLK